MYLHVVGGHLADKPHHIVNIGWHVFLALSDVGLQTIPKNCLLAVRTLDQTILLPALHQIMYNIVHQSHTLPITTSIIHTSIQSKVLYRASLAPTQPTPEAMLLPVGRVVPSRGASLRTGTFG